MHAHSEYEPTHQIRQHTGAVDLIFAGGERPLPKSGAQILETARATEFFEEARVETEYERGSIEFVPRAMMPNSIDVALVQGLLLSRFTITGAPPRGLQVLDAGTYYHYVDFIEGPDFEKGRWVGRIVDEAGRSACLVLGVEVKQIVHFHLDPQELEEHGRPRVHTHGIGVGEAANILVWPPPPEGVEWEETLSWERIGDDACKTTSICVPLA
jgi:hypothetical protein